MMWPFKREKKYWVVTIFHPERSVYLDKSLDGTGELDFALVFSRLIDVKRVVSAMGSARLSATYVRVRVDQTGKVALGLL